MTTVQTDTRKKIEALHEALVKIGVSLDACACCNGISAFDIATDELVADNLTIAMRCESCEVTYTEINFDEAWFDGEAWHDGQAPHGLHCKQRKVNR